VITINKTQEDDSGFVDEVRYVVAGCLQEYKPKEVYIIRIRDWFDYKWCYFSGKKLGAVGVSRFRDLTLPPFVPNRVLKQAHYSLSQTGGGEYEISEAIPLHIQQTSEANFKRLTRHATNDGTIIWYSSGSVSTCRGSIMVYNVTPNMKFGWHATFLKKDKWQIEKATFISKSLIKSLRGSGFKSSQIA
jgi:hypothetical protein